MGASSNFENYVSNYVLIEDAMIVRHSLTYIEMLHDIGDRKINSFTHSLLHHKVAKRPKLPNRDRKIDRDQRETER